MSILGNAVILGARGETASIVVTAETGSTITCTTPAGVVLSATESSGTWTFTGLSSYGNYTITSVRSGGSETKIKTVNIDEADVFEVEITYRLYLYNYGDQCTSVTGGWVAPSVSTASIGRITGIGYIYYDLYRSGSTSPTRTLNSDNISFNCTGKYYLAIYYYAVGSYRTTNAINFNKYKKLYVKSAYISGTTDTSYAQASCGVYSSVPDGSGVTRSSAVGLCDCTAGSSGVVNTNTLDISSLNSSYYVNVDLANSKNEATEYRFYQVYLDTE